MRLRRDSKIELLRKVPLFAGCSGRELGTVAQVADEVDLRGGEEVIREGDRGRQFFVLLDGKADVKRRGRKIAEMGKGDFFGEIALVSDRPTTASVTTTAPSRALVVTRQSFRRVLRDSPSVQLKVLEALAQRVPDV